MPSALTYPGVYIEEVPGTTRTIIAVATSIAAMVGRTPRGPQDDPKIVTSIQDFERQFGGLHQDYPLTYAVRDFFLNGGSQALILRLFNQPEGGAEFFLSISAGEGEEHGLRLFPKSPGPWATNLSAEVNFDIPYEVIRDYQVDPQSDPPEVLFNLMVTDESSGFSETFRNVSLLPNAFRPLKQVLEEDSTLVKLAEDDDTSEIAAFRTEFAKVLQTQKDLANARKAPPPATDLVTKAQNDVKAAQEKLKTAQDALAPDPSDHVKQKAVTDAQEALSGANKALDTLTNGVKNAQKLAKEAAAVVLKDDLSELKEAFETARKATPPVQADIDAAFTALTDKTKLAVDSAALTVNTYLGMDADDTPVPKSGLNALEKADLFNLMCIPPDEFDGDTDPTVYQTALSICHKRRAMLIVDPPLQWGRNPSNVTEPALDGLDDLQLNGEIARNGVIYFPRVRQADPLHENRVSVFAPSGIIAGIMARTDVTRGVWKAPAGIEAGLSGIRGLQVNLTDDENGLLNPRGINCLRSFPVYGTLVWGARTLRGADQLADEYKYVSVRRLLLFLEESLYRGTKWVVFEPNDEPLWSQIRLNIGAFMQGLFRQGAFQGQTPREAYFVKCDADTTTQNDINQGIVNIIVGFAPLKPAEFVVIKFQQIAGDIQV